MVFPFIYDSSHHFVVSKNTTIAETLNNQRSMSLVWMEAAKKAL